MRTKTKLVTAVGLAGLVAAGVNLRSGEVTAADHIDSPQSTADPAADITDFYAWHDGNGRLYAIVTFAGLQEAGGEPTYDPDVLYTIHIDDDMNRSSDQQIYVRFGQNMLEEWGVRVDGLPGEAASFEGAVGGPVAAPAGGQAQVGLFDDPFFFDLDGYAATLNSGTLSFVNTNDSFAGTNVTGIVLDMDAAAADADGDGELQMWVTTGRITR